MLNFDNGGSAPSPILRIIHPRFWSPSEVHSAKTLSLQFHRLQLSVERRSSLTHSSSTVFNTLTRQRTRVNHFFQKKVSQQKNSAAQAIMIIYILEKQTALRRIWSGKTAGAFLMSGGFGVVESIWEPDISRRRHDLSKTVQVLFASLLPVPGPVFDRKE